MPCVQIAASSVNATTDFPKISRLTSKLMLLSLLNISPCLTWVFTIDAYLVSQLPISHPRTVFHSAVSKASKMQTWLFGSLPDFCMFCMHVLLTQSVSQHRRPFIMWLLYLPVFSPSAPLCSCFFNHPERFTVAEHTNLLSLCHLLFYHLCLEGLPLNTNTCFSPQHFPLNIPFSKTFPDLLFLRRNLFSSMCSPSVC